MKLNLIIFTQRILKQRESIAAQAVVSYLPAVPDLLSRGFMYLTGLLTFIFCILILGTRLNANCETAFGKIDPKIAFSSRTLAGEKVRSSPVQDQNSIDSSDSITHEFMGFSLSGQAPGPALDVGCSTYGLAVRPLLKCGLKVLGVDQSIDALESFYSETVSINRGLLELHHGFFPAYPKISPDSLGSILISNIMYYMVPVQVEASFAKAFELLAPGGKLFVTAETAFHSNLNDPTFFRRYQERVSSGDLWPGTVGEDTTIYGISSANFFRNYLSVEILVREAEKVGFVVERSDNFDLSPNSLTGPLNLHQRAGLVARKPKNQ